MTFNLFKRLLPNGRSWMIIAEKRLRQFFEGLAAGASDPVVKEFDDRFDDLNPQLTTQLRTWEDQFALPNSGLTEQERRDRLQGAWSAVGGQSPRYIQDTLQAAGFNVFIHEWWSGSGGGFGPGGDSFTDLGPQFGSVPIGVACSGDGVVVYVVDLATASLYRSVDSGLSFTNLGAMPGPSPTGVACSDDGVIVYVIDNNTDSLYRSANSGDSFTDLGAQFSTNPSTLACSGDGVVVYVLDDVSLSLYRSDNSGVSFTDLGALFGAAPAGVACSGDGVIVYVVDNNTDSIYRSGNSGVSFTNLGAQFSTVPISVACSDDGVIVFVTDNNTDSLYRSTTSGASFTDLGAQFSTLPLGAACSGDGGVVYVVDIDSDSLYRSIGPALPSGPPPKGSINGVPVPVARDPFDYIIDPGNPVKFIGVGHDLAYCGGDSFFANAQETNNPQGYLLVNKIAQSVAGFVGSGNDLAFCGGDDAASGVSVVSSNMKTYTIPADPTKYPYFLYIGGQTFPELATLPLSRRDEFEDLCLKICPAQQWLGILVSYT